MLDSAHLPVGASHFFLQLESAIPKTAIIKTFLIIKFLHIDDYLTQQICFSIKKAITIHDDYRYIIFTK